MYRWSVAHLCVENVAEIARFLSRVEPFQLNQLSKSFAAGLITPSRSHWCVDVVQEYSHRLSVWRTEHVFHSLHQEAFHDSLGEHRAQYSEYEDTYKTNNTPSTAWLKVSK